MNLEDCKIGMKVTVDNIAYSKYDDSVKSTQLKDLVGTVVDLNEGYNIGVDFGVSVGYITWQLFNNICPNKTGRYIPVKFLNAVNPSVVELI